MGDNQYETAIIGAGPASLSATCHLSGHDTVMVAPERPPDSVTCGGVLTEPALSVLKQSDHLPLPHQLDGCWLDTVDLVSEGQIVEQYSPDPDLLATRRATLDQKLYQFARKNYHFSRRINYVREITHQQHTIQLRLDDGQTISCSGLIDASGHRRITDPDPTGETDQIGLEWTVDSSVNVSRSRLLMVLFDSGFAGISPLPSNQLNVSAAISHPVASNSPAQNVIEQLDRHLPDKLRALTDCLIQSKPTSKAGYRGQHSQPVSSRSVALGDAIGFYTPVTGEGIGMALRDGRVLGSTMTAGSTTWPLDRSHQRKLDRELVGTYRSQLPRWELTDWLARHGDAVRLLGNWLGGTSFLTSILWPRKNNWD